MTSKPTDDKLKLLVVKVLSSEREGKKYSYIQDLYIKYKKTGNLDQFLVGLVQGFDKKEKTDPEFIELANYIRSLAGRKTPVSVFGRLKQTLGIGKKNGVTDCQPPLEGSKYTFDDIAGQKQLKQDMKINYIYPYQFPLLFPKKGNILLYGPPGVGKSFTAKAATAELKNVAFYAPTAGEMKGKFEGETEKNIDRVFKCAGDILKTGNGGKYKFSIIFFDEFDAIAGKGRGEDASLSRSVNALLAAMDGIKSQTDVIVLAATNYPQNLDEAILRRFDTRIFVDVPDAKARKFLIKQALLDNYYYPGVSKEDLKRKQNIKEISSKFVPYQLIGKYGYCEEEEIEIARTTMEVLTRKKKKTEKKKTCFVVNDAVVDKLVKMTGPLKVGIAIKSEIEKNPEDPDIDKDMDQKPPQFGYSGSDITKLMQRAFQKASFRSLKGPFVIGSKRMKDLNKRIKDLGGKPKNVPEEYRLASYWIYNPDEDEDFNVSEEYYPKLINFDLREEDLLEAKKEYSSTVKNESYIELYKYYKS